MSGPGNCVDYGCAKSCFFFISDKKKYDSNMNLKKVASESVGTRRKTNSYVGKPILTSEPVGFFFQVFFASNCFLSIVLLQNPNFMQC